MRVPTLETERLAVRPLTMADLDAVHRILDVELEPGADGVEAARRLAERQAWLQWTVLSYEQLAKLHQPPYGERAIILRERDRLIGLVGYVPCLDAFGQIAGLSPDDHAEPGRTSTEFGLYWAVSPAFQGRGYATEAADAMIRFAFRQLRLRRIVATTDYDNAASLRVMQKLGMRIETNPADDPPWLQAVGILESQAESLAGTEPTKTQENAGIESNDTTQPDPKANGTKGMERKE